MTRVWLVVAISSLGAWAGGCSMCASPYDYCGPVVDGSGCPSPCGIGAPRRGSILSSGGFPSGVEEGEVIYEGTEYPNEGEVIYEDAGFGQYAPQGERVIADRAVSTQPPAYEIAPTAATSSRAPASSRR